MRALAVLLAFFALLLLEGGTAAPGGDMTFPDEIRRLGGPQGIVDDYAAC
ncbi:MAG: hypothetical protein ACLQU4_04955 [Limisphaerales bacterium]